MHAKQPVLPASIMDNRARRVDWSRRHNPPLVAAVLRAPDRHEADDARHVEYCTINPLKHRLVARVRDWPHPSFRRDLRAGSFPVDGAAAKRSARRRAPISEKHKAKLILHSELRVQCWTRNTIVDPEVTRTQAASATLSPERPSLSVLAHQTSSSSIGLA
jgi:hypothetical protein